MQSPDVSVVVVPRDHFSDTRESLESVLGSMAPSCRLIVVDGGSPRAIARYLRERAASAGFDLIRRDYYLTPNQARNLAAARAATRYIAFVDNDVVVAPNWLGPLVECAEATGAAVVGPLNFEGRPFERDVHFAGGDTRVDIVSGDGRTRRHLVDRIHKTFVPSAWTRTDVAEFHCMLVRRAVFERLGGLDEKLLSTRENIDFCLALRGAGESVYLEPRAKVTYLPPDPLHLLDMPYFALRWSDAWDLASFQHLRDKWQLEEDDYFRRQYENLGWRRQGLMMRAGLLRWLRPWRVRIAVERALGPLERRINARIAARHADRHPLQPAAH